METNKEKAPPLRAGGALGNASACPASCNSESTKPLAEVQGQIPNLLSPGLHRELAAEALDGVSFQTAAVVRFLAYADDAAAIEAYKRAISLIQEFASPSMKAIAAAHDPLTAEAAVEWRAERDKAREMRGRR